MSEKEVKTRIQQKHDIEANWSRATGFIPKIGEIIIYDKDESHDYVRVKIGDGINNPNGLDFYAGSWNDLEDRPFGEETTTVGGDTLTWDGNTEGLLAPPELGSVYFKFSDAVPSLEEVKKGAVITTSDGKTTNFDESQLIDLGHAYGYEGVLIFPTADLTVPGVYLFNTGSVYVTSLTIPGYTGFETTTTVVKPIETKYLPEHLQFGEEKAFEPIVWDGNTEGLETFYDGSYVKIASYVSITDPSQVENFILKLFDENGNVAREDNYAGSQCVEVMEHGWAVAGGEYALASDGQLSMNGIDVPEGVWGANFPALGLGSSETITILPSTTVKPLNEKYIPDSIARVSDIPASTLVQIITWEADD